MQRSDYFLVFALVFGALLLSIVPIYKLSSLFYTREFKATVLEKEHVKRGKDSFYLVYTDSMVVKLDDSVWHGNFNASEQYRDLRKDSTYTFTTFGYRVGFLSDFPTVITFKTAH